MRYLGRHVGEGTVGAWGRTGACGLPAPLAPVITHQSALQLRSGGRPGAKEKRSGEQSGQRRRWRPDFADVDWGLCEEWSTEWPPPVLAEAGRAARLFHPAPSTGQSRLRKHSHVVVSTEAVSRRQAHSLPYTGGAAWRVCRSSTVHTRAGCVPHALQSRGRSVWMTSCAAGRSLWLPTTLV